MTQKDHVQIIFLSQILLAKMSRQIVIRTQMMPKLTMMRRRKMKVKMTNRMPKKVSVANFTVKLDFMNFLSFFLFITAESLMYLRIRMGQPIGEKIKRDEMINTYGEG